MLERKIKEPNLVGDKLQHFTNEELCSLLSKACGKCNTDECDGCPGLAILMNVENQIGEEGIAFMKQLVRDWIL